MICLADTVGVFQIESRAQMSMLPRLRPRTFYDLVVEVAIVRPGPIQGDMVHPYLRRRNGEEPVHYPDEAVRKVLAKTLGVPLFQEQAMALAVVAAGFTPGQADELRRAIAAWKRNGNRIAAFGESLMAGMAARGYGERFAHQVFEQIKGFAGYGFPESHAASFALLVYSSAWLKRHHPAAFAAALLNSQPMGFYAPAQILRDVGDHGVAVREVDVHASCWDCTLERGADLVAMLAACAAGASARERGRDLFGRPLAGDDGPAAVCSDTRTPSSSHPDHGRFVRIDACGGAPCIELREEHRRTFASSRLPTAGTPSVGSGNDADLRRWRTLGHPAEMDAAGAASVPRKTKDVETQHRPDVEGDAFRAVGPSGMSGHLPVDPFQPPGVSCTGHGRRDGATAAVRRAHARGRSVQRDGDRSDPSPEPLQAPSLTQVDADGRMHEPRRTDDRTDGRDSPARDFAVPTQPALRLGLRMVRGLAFEEAERVVAAVRRHGTFERMRDLFDASGVRVATLRRLAAADAFRSMGLDRQQATWQILALRDRERPLWSFGPSEACTSESEALQVPTQSGDGLQAAMAGEGLPPSRAVIPTQDEHEPNLPRVSRLAAITRDLESTGVSTRGHPIECIRPRLQRARAIPCGFLREPDRTPAGRRVVVAGLVLVRQRPSTAKGVVFMTIEDGSGIANLVYRPRIYERLRKTVRQAQALLVRGMVERRDGVVHVLVDAAKSLAGAWDDPASAPPVHARDFH
jgi:DNA polymerase III alpha subunit